MTTPSIIRNSDWESQPTNDSYYEAALGYLLGVEEHGDISLAQP